MAVFLFRIICIFFEVNLVLTVTICDKNLNCEWLMYIILWVWTKIPSSGKLLIMTDLVIINILT